MTSVRSGIDRVEERWGGLRRGGIYLLCGPPTEARHRLALQVVAAAVATAERCLLVSPQPARDLASRAAEIGLDLNDAQAADVLRVVPPPVPAGADPAHEGARALEALTEIVRRDLPARLVFDGLAALAFAGTSERFSLALLRLLVTLDETGTTAVLVLDEPERAPARHVLDVLHGHLDGTIRLAADGTCTLTQATNPEAASSEATWQHHLARLARPPLAHPTAVTEALPAGDGADADALPERPPALWGGGAPADDPPHGDGTAPDEAALPGIRFLDLSSAPAAPAEDPFREAEPLVGGLRMGLFVGHEPPATPYPPGKRLTAEAPAEDPFTFVQPSRSAASASRGLLPLLAPAPAALDRADRAAFAAAFDAAVHAWEEQDRTFLALGLQLPRDYPEARPLALLAAGLAVALGGQDRLFVNEERRCVAALLIGRRPGSVPALLRQLAALVEAAMGPEAAAVLTAVSTTTAPNGYPFRTGDAFLHHLCGEE